MANKAYCVYFIVNEEGESEEMPNCVELLSVGGQITLKSLQLSLQRLPGIYHIRCRVEDSSCGYAWLDVTDPNEKLPFTEGCIFAKVN